MKQENMNKSAVPYNTLSSLNKFGEFLKDLWKDVYSGKLTQDYFEITKENGIDYHALTNTVLSIASSIPYVGPVFGFFTPIINLFWPEDHPDLFEILKDKIEALINKKLAEDAVNRLKKEVEGFKNDSESLACQVKIYLDDEGTCEQFSTRDSGVKGASIAQTIINIHHLWIQRIPQFTIDEYKQYALPLYVQAANMHLMLLKDAISHQKDWGIDDADVKTISEFLKIWIVTHSKYVYDIFKGGITNIQNDPQEGNKDKAIADYIRASTLTGLDYVALWPTFDKDVYPMQTDLEQTRLIFSDITGRLDWRGQWSAGDWSKYTYGNFPGELGQFTTCTGDRVDLILQILDVPTDYKKYIYGGYTAPCNAPYKPSRENPIIGVSALGASPYVGLRIKFADGYTVDNGADTILGTHHLYDKEIVAPENHKVHFIFPFRDELGGQDAWVNSFVFNDLYPECVIGKPDPITGNLVIKGFPAEKTVSFDSDMGVKESMNGANAMRFSPGSSLSYQIQNETSPLRCRIRYRVATKSTDSLRLSGFGGRIYDTNLPNTEHDQTNQKGIPGDNGYYMLVNGPTLLIDSGKQDFNISNIGSQDFVLDRIEFVPISKPGYDGGISITFGVHVHNTDPSPVTLWEFNKDYSIYNFDLTGTLYGDTQVIFQLWNNNEFETNLPTSNDMLQITPSGTDISFQNITVPAGFNIINFARILGNSDEVTGHLTLTIP